MPLAAASADALTVDVNIRGYFSTTTAIQLMKNTAAARSPQHRFCQRRE